MHLSLLREYLDLEFSSLKETLPFKYDLERIIDDFILLALFVGNDFLPHLPNLHIHEGAIGLMFSLYKKMLPTCEGYLQDGGQVDLGRLQKLLDGLGGVVEKDAYEAEREDMLFLAGKRENGQTEKELLHNLEKKKSGALGKLILSLTQNSFLSLCSLSYSHSVITETQRKLFERIKEFILEHSPANPGSLHFEPELNARNRKFVEKVAFDFGLHFATEYSNEDNSKHVYIEFEENEEGEEDTEEELDEEAIAARDRVLAKYENATIIPDVLTEEELRKQEQEEFEAGFKEWKREYYRVCGPK